MTNTLYLPELREALATHDLGELKEFCAALHPARTAEFMEGLTPEEAWEVLQHADTATRAAIFNYFDRDKQVAIIEQADRAQIGRLIGDLPPDDRVDILNRVDPDVVKELLPYVPHEQRRDILRLSAYPEGTAGAMMTTQFARLSESWTVKHAMEEVAKQAEGLETIYCLYVVDDGDHLRGLVTARQLVSAMGRPNTKMSDLMETDIVSVNVADDQEEVARKVAKYDLLAIPVVDDEYHMLGIITHDDVIDVMREEATEDVQRLAAVAPLEHGYMETSLFTLAWKRGIWLTILFVGALSTAHALGVYDERIHQYSWLVLFIPLVISTGGNSGSQSATLIITALSTGDIKLTDWWRVLRREVVTGALLGSLLGLIGFFVALIFAPTAMAALVIPLTVLLVVIWGTMAGSLLPLIFSRLGLDPALMSNPFVACLSDLAGILIYMNVALAILSRLAVVE